MQKEKEGLTESWQYQGRQNLRSSSLSLSLNHLHRLSLYHCSDYSKFVWLSAQLVAAGENGEEAGDGGRRGRRLVRCQIRARRNQRSVSQKQYTHSYDHIELWIYWWFHWLLLGLMNWVCWIGSSTFDWLDFQAVCEDCWGPHRRFFHSLSYEEAEQDDSGLSKFCVAFFFCNSITCWNVLLCSRFSIRIRRDWK